MGPLLVKSGFLFLLFWDGGQQSACLVFILLQEHLSLILRQLDVLQLLQQVALLLRKTAARWITEGKVILEAGDKMTVYACMNWMPSSLFMEMFMSIQIKLNKTIFLHFSFTVRPLNTNLTSELNYRNNNKS